MKVAELLGSDLKLGQIVARRLEKNPLERSTLESTSKKKIPKGELAESDRALDSASKLILPATNA